MDWILQNKLIKWLIGVLLIVNILTITIIWILITHDKQPPLFERGGKPPGGKELMQRELNLTDLQTQQFENARKENFEKSQILFKQLDSAKKQYFEELLKEKSDTALVNSILLKMNSIQMELEKLRFGHFKYLLSLCNSEQREKFAPTLKEFIVGKPPQEKGKGGPDTPPGMDGMKNNEPPPPPNGNPKGMLN